MKRFLTRTAERRYSKKVILVEQDSIMAKIFKR
jgi:hypothetical protein